MHIQCTKKLLDFLKPTTTNKNTDSDLYAWHANYIVNDRKKLLVIMNDLTRFSLVFYGIKKSDFKNINVWFVTALYNAMSLAGFSGEDIIKYFDGAPDIITYNKTKNRTLVARLNKAVEIADIMCQNEGVYIDVLEQNHIAQSCNEILVCQDNYKICYVPKEQLKAYIDMLD
jgi:hypothetical protein